MKAVTRLVLLIIISVQVHHTQLASAQITDTPLSLPKSAQPKRPSPSEIAALGLADLERLALQNNPTLVQASAQIDAAKARALQAKLWPNPKVGYLAEQIGVEGTIGEFQGGFVQQTIITAHKRRISQAKYNQQAREASFLALVQQLRVLNGVRTHFFDLLASHRMVLLHQDLLANRQENLRTTLEMFNTGQANKAQVLLVENEVFKAKIDLQMQKNRRQAIWQDLTAVVGVPDLTTAPVQGHLEPDGPPLAWESSLQLILQDSPELLAAQAHVVFDQISLQREKVQPIPNISVAGSTGYNAEAGETVAGVEIGFQLPLWNRNQGTIAQVQADIVRSQADVRRVELSLRQRFAHQFKHYQNALVKVNFYRDQIIPKAEEAYEIQLKMYKQRRIAWPEVVKLKENVIMAELDYVIALKELRSAEVAIKGLLIVDGLTLPMAPPSGGHIQATPQPR